MDAPCQLAFRRRPRRSWAGCDEDEGEEQRDGAPPGCQFLCKRQPTPCASDRGCAVAMSHRSLHRARSTCCEHGRPHSLRLFFVYVPGLCFRLSAALLAPSWARAPLWGVKRRLTGCAQIANTFFGPWCRSASAQVRAGPPSRAVSALIEERNAFWNGLPTSIARRGVHHCESPCSIISRWFAARAPVQSFRPGTTTTSASRKAAASRRAMLAPTPLCAVLVQKEAAIEEAKVQKPCSN